MGIKFEGFDKLKRKLEDLGRRAQELDGEQVVSFAELFPSEFIREHTTLGSMQELMDESGFKIETQEDFKAIPADEWDEYIRKVTRFPNWEVMMSEAVKVYTVCKLGL